MAQLELHGINKKYGNIVAVEDIDIVVPDNEFFCIFGPPGCGKTTLLRLWLGLENADSGEIVIDGQVMTHQPPAARNLSMVFQNLALFPHMTARDNLRFPLVERKLPANEVEKRVAQVAETLHITPLLNKMPAHLSGGERQRVAIGRSLVRDPAAYLMDEPISALDARLREEMRVELNRLQRELNHTLIYVTHDQEEAMSVSDRMCIMQDGKVVQVGTPDEIYNSPATRYVAEFVGSPPINLIEGRFANGTFNSESPNISCNANGSSNVADCSAFIGFRPEDISVSRAPTPGSIAAEVFALEPLGAWTGVDIKVGQGVVRVQVSGQPDFALKEPVHITPNLERSHFFDTNTGTRFASGASAQG